MVFYLLVCVVPGAVAVPSYDDVLDIFYANPATTDVVNGGLWVPWYASSSSCAVDDLHQGSSCDGGEVIDLTHNCMVTDEFSQVAIWTAYGGNQTRMDQVVTTIREINSSFGVLPAWRVYRSGQAIEACRAGIDGNCDTASDATARFIIALSVAGNYQELEAELASDMVRYEVLNVCHETPFGQVCHWLASGSQAKRGGMSSTDFGYTGYYADAALAMFRACQDTGNQTFCAVGRDFQLNYLQAAAFDGSHFTVPPGKSFKWTNLASQPIAVCTNTCSPVQWDYDDAARALGFCGVYGYGVQHNISMPVAVGTYCALWLSAHMEDPSAVPLQYAPDGTASTPQSGYWAQGLAAMFYDGWQESARAAALDASLGHFTGSSFDNAACFGVYRQSPVMRMYGESSYSAPTDGPVEDGAAPADVPSAPADAPLAPAEVPMMQDQMHFPLQQQDDSSGYIPTYTKDDFSTIVVDGVGTVLAAFVEQAELVVIVVVLAIAVVIIVNRVR